MEEHELYYCCGTYRWRDECWRVWVLPDISRKDLDAWCTQLLPALEPTRPEAGDVEHGLYALYVWCPRQLELCRGPQLLAYAIPVDDAPGAPPLEADRIWLALHPPALEASDIILSHTPAPTGGGTPLGPGRPLRQVQLYGQAERARRAMGRAVWEKCQKKEDEEDVARDM